MARKQLCFEPALTAARELLATQAQETPELRGGVVVFDWCIGREEFPPGVVFSTDKSLAGLLTIAQQMLRMTSLVVGRLDEAIKKAEEKLRAGAEQPPKDAEQ